MHTADAQIGKRGGQFLRVLLGGLELDGQLVVFLDHRAHDEHLPPLADEPADEIVEPRAVRFADGEGIHLLAAGRQLVENGDVQIAVDDERERARYRRRGHDEHMRLLPLADERRALADTEAVLLVGDDEGKI